MTRLPAPAAAPTDAPAAATAPTATAPAVVVRREALGDIAWQILLRDGDLVLLRHDAALPAGVPSTPGLRAEAVAPLVPDRCAVARAAAVWVLLGGPAPDDVHVVAPRGVRVRDPAVGRSASVADLPDRDVVAVAGVRVTTPRRTAVDLLSHESPERALPLVARLAAAGLDLARVRADVATAAGRRGIRAAAALLPRLAAEGQASTTGWSDLAPVMR